MKRREGLSRLFACLLVIVLAVSACTPTAESEIVEKEVTRVVKETVVVPGTPEVVEKVVTATPPPPPEPVTITWATWGGAIQAELYQEAIRQFHAKQDLVRVENINSPGMADHMQKVQTMIAGGTPPDVIMVGGENVPAFAAQGIYQPLDPFIEADPDFDIHDYLPRTIEVMKYEGKIYSLPGGFNIGALYYNKALFDEAGLDYPTRDWTHDDLLEAAKKLTKRENGRVIQYGYTNSPLNMWFFIWQNGGEIFDNDTNPTVMLLDQPAALETVEWYFDLSLEHGVKPTLVELMQSGGQQELFASGQLAMLIDHRGATQVLNQITDFEWGICELPRGSAGRAVVFNWAGRGIATGSKHPQEAWEFLKWLTGPEGVRIFIASGNGMPALYDLLDDPTLEIQQPFVDAVPYARPFFASPKWNDLLPTMLQYLQLMAIGEMEPKEAVPLMKQEVDALLAQ